MLVFCFSPNRYTWLTDIICLMGSVVISAWIVFTVAFLIAWLLENVHQDEVAAYHSSQEHGLLNKTAWVQISALSLVSTMSLGKQLAFHSSLIKCRQKNYSVLWFIRSFVVQLLSLWLFPVDCMQHTSILCSSLSPGVFSDSCPLSQWYHPTISSSVALFYSCPQSFPVSGSFPVSWHFTSGGQSTRASALASVQPMNIQAWFPIGLTGLISLLSKGLSRVFSSTTVWKHKFFGTLPSLAEANTLKCL